MPKKIAVIDYAVCQPELCEDGRCKAAEACPRKQLLQELPYEAPEPPMICIGCGVCALECPKKAVKMI